MVRLGQWYTTTIAVRGADVRILLDGQAIGQASDAGWLTGRVGLGTKADSFRRIRAVTAASQ